MSNEESLEIRVRELERDLVSLEGLLNTENSLVKQSINQIHEDLGILKLEIKDEFKTKADKDDFSLIQKIVFGAVGVILLSFLTAMLAVVVNSGGAP